MNIERHRQLLFSGAAALGGTLLFAYAVGAVGLPIIADGIRRVGAGVFIILAIAGLRFCLRTQAWRLCMRPEVRLPFGVALRAFLAGDAIGSVTPLGLVASEPTKMLIASSRLPASEAVDLSVTIASKLLQRNVSKDDNARLIEDTFKQIEASGRPS